VPFQANINITSSRRLPLQGRNLFYPRLGESFRRPVTPFPLPRTPHSWLALIGRGCISRVSLAAFGKIFDTTGVHRAAVALAEICLEEWKREKTASGIAISERLSWYQLSCNPSFGLCEPMTARVRRSWQFQSLFRQDTTLSTHLFLPIGCFLSSLVAGLLPIGIQRHAPEIKDQ
jgi:hypothetical protein